MLGVFLALKSFSSVVQGKHVKLLVDNTTAVSTINQMGTFSVIQRVLQKNFEEETTGLLVVPHWPTQTWWPYLMNMLIDFPLLLPRKEDTLYLPAHPQLLHPLHKELQLLACHLSGSSLQAEAFRLGLHQSSCNLGERVHKSSTRLTTSDGKSSVVQGILIPFQLL